MYALTLLVAASIPSAPVPPPKPLPEFKPGVYQMKWGDSEWGTVLFEKGGFYGYNYRTRRYIDPWRQMAGLDDGGPEINESPWEGKWSWNPKTRELTIEEAAAPHGLDTKLSKYVFKFGRKLDEGKGPSATILLRPHK